MRAVNNTMRHHQMKKHFNHISGCSDHEYQPDLKNIIERITNLEKGGGSGSCDCGEQLSEMVSNITVINTNISKIHTNIEHIYDLLNGIAITPRSATVKISPLSATGLDSLETTYAKLLSNIETADEEALDDYYKAVISPIVGSNSLTAPIDLAAIESATLCSSLYDIDNDGETDAITWSDLTDNPEDKRTYIKQFILASPSNQTRAAYVTNEMLKSFAVVTDEPSKDRSVTLTAKSKPRCVQDYDDDPTMITLENQAIRLRGCPYLML